MTAHCQLAHTLTHNYRPAIVHAQTRAQQPIKKTQIHICAMQTLNNKCEHFELENCLQAWL